MKDIQVELRAADNANTKVRTNILTSAEAKPLLIFLWVA